MDAIFKALADPTRRQVLDQLLAEPGQTLTELVDGLAMRRQSVSRHIAILENAGLVTSRRQGREKHHYLNPVPIAGIGRRWIDKFSGVRADALMNLKLALENSNVEATNREGDKNE